MKSKTEQNAELAAALTITGLGVLFWIGVIYVAFHFITKYW